MYGQSDTIFETIYNMLVDIINDDQFIIEAELDSNDSIEILKEFLETVSLATEYLILQSALEDNEDVVINKLPVVYETSIDVINDYLFNDVMTESGIRAKLQSIKSRLSQKVSGLKERLRKTQLASKLASVRDKVKHKAADIRYRVALAIKGFKDPTFIYRELHDARQKGLIVGGRVGSKKAERIGKERGFREGYRTGYDEGYIKGYNVGEEEGINRGQYLYKSKNAPDLRVIAARKEGESLARKVFDTMKQTAYNSGAEQGYTHGYVRGAVDALKALGKKITTAKKQKVLRAIDIEPKYM